MKKRKASWAVLLALAMTSCDAFDYHPYCVDISGRTGINDSNIKEIEQATQGRTSFKFAFVSDTQRWYDETEALVADINGREDIDFVVHGGDLTDFGVNQEFLWQRDILEDLDVPYVAIIGNHDCLGTGKQTYRRVWGELNFAFSAGDVRFVCMNTNALEFDYSTPVPDMSFIKSELNNYPEECGRTIIVGHCMPYDDPFNDNMAEYYHYYVKQFPGVMFHLSGHVHSFEVREPFDDGFIYYTTTCMKDRAYMIFTITDDGYSYETVTF